MVMGIRNWLVGPDAPQLPVGTHHVVRGRSSTNLGSAAFEPDNNAVEQRDLVNGSGMDARLGGGLKQGPLVEEQRESWRSQVGSKVVQYAWDKLCGSLVQQWVYNTWYAALTPDREFPAEVSGWSGFH